MLATLAVLEVLTERPRGAAKPQLAVAWPGVAVGKEMHNDFDECQDGRPGRRPVDARLVATGPLPPTPDTLGGGKKARCGKAPGVARAGQGGQEGLPF